MRGESTVTPDRGPTNPERGTPADPVEEVLPADEARVRELLRSADDVGPMPADVVARLDAALAHAATSTPVASLDARRRARVRRFQRVFATAAGIAVVAVGGGIALVSGGALDGGGGSSADSASSVAADDLPAGTQLLRSGRDFSNVAAVRDVAEDVVGEVPADVSEKAEPAPDAAGSTDGDAGPNLLAAPAEPGSALPADTDVATPAEDQRAVAEHVVGCAGVDPASVVAVEIATWDTEPAALVVHRTADGAEAVVVALVVALDCSPGEAALSTVELAAP